MSSSYIKPITPVSIQGDIPLAGGAATEAEQVVGNASLANIDLKTPALVAGRQPVDGSGVTQPISAEALPLPLGASSESTLASLNAKVTAVDTAAVIIASSALPSGASTAANQTAANASLASIDTKTPSLGQALAASSTPVVLPASQIAALTAPAISIADTANLDAFGRLRASNPDTIFDNNFRNSKQALLWTELLASGGTATHVPNSAAVALAVTAASGSSAIYQTRRYFPYNAGKSQLIIYTGVFGPAQANTRKRYGYFDANDGLYFEQDGATVNVVQRSATSGAPVNTAVPQASWNIDPLNGTGPSGITLNLAQNNIFLIDFEWLGAGRVRMGVVIGGKIVYCHQFLNANSISVPYMRSGSLPLRAEIVNTAAAAAPASLTIVCQTVISEGGNQRFGTQRTASRDFTLRTVTTAYTPVISMRLKAANITAVARLLEAGAFGTTADALNLSIIINPATLTGATWALTANGETVEADIEATAMTGGTVVNNAYINASGGGVSTGTLALETALNAWLGSSLAGVADVFTLACRCRTGTADVTGFITWLEL